MEKTKIILSAICLLLVFSACGERKGVTESRETAKKNSGAINFSGTDEGARQLLSQFLPSGIDKEALTKQLRPTSKDFKAVFISDVAAKVEEGYRQPWEEGRIVIHGQPGETELLIGSATTEELQKQSGDAGYFPIGYTKAAPYFNAGLRIYRFKFVRPGDNLGFAWDGLMYVNGHWAFFPQPWRVIPGLVINAPAPAGR